MPAHDHQGRQDTDMPDAEQQSWTGCWLMLSLLQSFRAGNGPPPPGSLDGTLLLAVTTPL